MQNINELIGIFKGIDFDNVINEHEVLCLKTWVDKSRNLANTVDEIEFIKLLDDVLEDNIITLEEKRRVNAYIKKFMANDSTEAKLSELNGIIRGVISDGEVNTPEIVKLKDWLEKHSGLMTKAHVKEIYTVLCGTIDGNRIIKEKQDKILQLLKERLEDARFKTRLDSLCNLVKTRKNIGPDIIEFLDKEDAIQTIHELAEKELDRAIRSSSGNLFFNPEIVFISLVLIGMFKYNGNFYEGVEDTYPDLYNKFSGQKIEGTIRSLINRYKSKSNNSGRTINLVLSNSIVPREYLGAFFSFIFDIYKINFDYDIDSFSDLYEEFRFIYDGLRSAMLNNSDDVTVKVTNKSYKLIKSTKELIINENSLDALIKLSVMVLKLIDARYWNQVNNIVNPFLQKGFTEWEKTIVRAPGPKHKRIITSEPYSRWEPKLYQKGNSVVIAPPVHRIKAEDPNTIKIVVLNDDKELISISELDIREIFGGYKINSPEIPVKNPLGRLQYRIYADGKVIYDTKNKLYRELIVFGENGEELKNNKDYKGTAVFCYSDNTSDLESYYACDEYALAVRTVKYGDSFTIGNTLFSFTSLIKPGVYGDLNNNCKLIASDDGKQILSFKDIKFLVFESANKLARYNLVIDRKAYKLNSFKPTITNYDNKSKYVVDLKGFDTGIHNISVIEHIDGNKKKICSFDFVIDKNLIYTTEKIGEEEYEITVNSDLIEAELKREISLSEFNEKIISLFLGGKEYFYEIPFDISMYRLDDGVWRSMETYIWIEEIKQDSVISFYNPKADAVTIHLPSGENIGNNIPMKTNGLYVEVPAGFLVSYKTEHDYLVIVLTHEEKATAGIYCYNKCVLRPDDVEINFDSVDEILDISAMYYGKGNVYFEVIDENGFIGYTSSFIMPGEAIQVGDIPSFETLTFVFYEKGKGLLKKTREIVRVKRCFYGMSGLVGREFKINEVFYDQYVRGQLLRKSRRFGNTFLSILSRETEFTFTAEVYFKNRYRTFELYNVNPVNVEVCSTEIDGCLELSITKDGDGLLLDFVNNGILNNVTDHKAIDIYSYNILLEDANE